MEVAVGSPVLDLNLMNACSSPYLTPPSSPQHSPTPFFFSAPTTPRRCSVSSPSSPIALSPPSPASTHQIRDDDPEFEFDFSGQLDRTSLSAEELFSEGKIRPLLSDPLSRSFNSSMDSITQGSVIGNGGEMGKKDYLSSSSSSPLRISDLVFAPDTESVKRSISSSSYESNAATTSFLEVCKKWRARGFLLFRSSSEGRPSASGNARPVGYAGLSKTNDRSQGSSFRTVSGSGSGSRRRAPASAHEIHYTTNRAMAEEMRRKTFLPYKPDLLGCMGFRGFRV